MEAKSYEKHNVTLLDRKQLRMTGIKKVVSLEPERVEVLTEQEQLIIKGQDLHTEKLDMEKGELQLAGVVQGMLYSNATGKKSPSTVAKRLFR